LVSSAGLHLLGGDSAGVGNDTSRFLNDVWSSTDGATWVLQTASAPWTPRKFMGAAADDQGHLFVAGGYDGTGSGGLSDVWRSEDGGKTWSVVLRAAPWTARHSHSLTPLLGGAAKGRLYILGGSDGRLMHDVWFSDDRGATWTLMRFTHTRDLRYTVREDRASWTPRALMAVVTSGDGRVVLIGGETGGEVDEQLSKQVWQLPAPPSSDIAWYEAKSRDMRLNLAFPPLEWKRESTPPWRGRRSHAAFVDGGGVPHIIGGEIDGGFRSDMWRMEVSLDLNNLRGLY